MAAAASDVCGDDSDPKGQKAKQDQEFYAAMVKVDWAKAEVKVGLISRVQAIIGGS